MGVSSADLCCRQPSLSAKITTRHQTLDPGLQSTVLCCPVTVLGVCMAMGFVIVKSFVELETGIKYEHVAKKS